jgi:hypothetical protein
LRDHSYAQRALQAEEAFAACMACKDFGAQHAIEPVLEST